MPGPDDCRQLVSMVASRTAQILGALGRLDDLALRSPSELPEWSRLTIICHLRYGAEALTRMTEAVQAGRTTSYYPLGREVQRPHTLVPRSDEHPDDVVASLILLSEKLDRGWRHLDDDVWALEVIEPEDNPDLGAVTMAMLPLLRLTEVEVHGSDLGLGLDDWSDLFVHTALPTRLGWLNRRRVNHRSYDAALDGSWLLIATDGPTTLVTVRHHTVETVPAASTTPARSTMEGSSRDLLALLLGRALSQPLRVTGDADFARSFAQAFPGP